MTAPDPDSPARLTGGAWVRTGPGPLRWVPGARPAAWQDNTPTACGSRAGRTAHRKAGEKPCALCDAAERDYFRDRYERITEAAA